MAASTGPVVAAGAISYANAVIGNGQNPLSELRIVVATAIAAGLLALAEHAQAQLAVGVAWIALVTCLLYTPKSGQSPVANLLRLTGLGGKS